MGVSNGRDLSLSDRRTYYIVTRRENVTGAEFDYTQPYELSVVDGLAPHSLATLAASVSTSASAAAVCYYIVGQSSSSSS